MIDDMACQRFIELVTAYLEGSLSSSERAQFEAHLENCSHCTRYLEQMHETIRLVGKISEASLTPEIKAEMLGRFRDWTRG